MGKGTSTHQACQPARRRAVRNAEQPAPAAAFPQIRLQRFGVGFARRM
jgi:hypothetical protein